jgi:hypothetical protein
MEFKHEARFLNRLGKILMKVRLRNAESNLDKMI